MKVIANSVLYGSRYGRKLPNEEFEVDEETGSQLLKTGKVRHARPPKVQYETKVIIPEAPEVSARQPFRNLPHVDAEPATVAPAGHKIISSTTLFTSGTTDPPGRGRRSGSNSER